MRAALYEAGSTDLTIGDVDIDDPAPGRVRVRAMGLAEPRSRSLQRMSCVFSACTTPCSTR